MGWRDRLPFGSSNRRIEELESRVQELTEERSIDTLPWNTGADTSTRTPTASRAMRLAPYLGGISLIARTISTTPVHAYRKTGDSRTRMPYLPPLLETPSIHGDITDWLHRFMVSLLTEGNAYGLITGRDGHGYPTTIEWLKAQEVYVVDEGQWGRGSYWNPIYYWRGREIDPEQIVHVPWISVPFRVKGINPLQALASAISIGESGQTYANDWYRAGGVPPGTFKNSAKTVGDREAEIIKGRLVNSIRTHEPLVYGADWDYNAIAINPKDALFIETHAMSATDIATVLGIYPAERIGGTTPGRNVSYTNVEQEQIQFMQLTLLSYYHKIESVVFDLLPQPQFIKFNLDALIRPDSHTRRQIYQLDRDIGLRNIDEIRDEIDMARLPNGQGQSYAPLITVRETIKADALSQTNPNFPGFKTIEPPAPGVPGEPGAASTPDEPSVTGQPEPVATNGRFTGQPDELVPVGRAREDDGDVPPF